MYYFYLKKLVQRLRCIPKILSVINAAFRCLMPAGEKIITTWLNAAMSRINDAEKRKWMMRINGTTLLLMASILQVSATTFAQKVTLSRKNAPLSEVFTQIKSQTGYDFVFTASQLKDLKPVSINVKDAELDEVLSTIFKGLPLSYTIEDKSVVVSGKKTPSFLDRVAAAFSAIDVGGKVVDEKGEPIPGATVSIKGTGKAVITNTKGEFTLTSVDEKAELLITSIGYKALTLKVARDMGIIKMEANVSALDQVQVIGYGTTTQRLNTGNVSSVKAADIETQPVSNPLAALAGRVAGLSVTQSSGVPGAGFKVQIRGQNSLLQGSEPFYVIDGIPFVTGNTAINQLSSAAGSPLSGTGMSPFNLINPSDIESIDVLKDADATAIYGSRGANGVILITTKKGKSGPVRLSFNAYSGASKVSRTMDMLNTQQYLEMRREGFKNSGVTPTTTNAPDLLLWDTSRSTDFKKLLIGGTAHTTDAQLSLSGGSINTQFTIGGGYHHETTVFPTDLGDTRGSFNLSLNHHSTDNKLNIALIANYAANKNNLTATDLSSYISSNPMLQLYTPEGKLNWAQGGKTYYSLGILNSNPLAFQYQAYTGNFNNLNSNLLIGYRIIPDLLLKVSMGYNSVNSHESSIFPGTSIDPYSFQQPYSNFANRTSQSWIIEPQAQYTKPLGAGKLDVLIGGTWQDQSSNGLTIAATNYNGDLLLNSIAAAGATESNNTYSQYRYEGVYGRINYNLQDKYIVNISGRRDGSSRFGSQSRFSNFAAAGAAWIFSEEKFIKNRFGRLISFGKLRASYGLTGNDQIGDYRYLDTWTPASDTYQSVSILNPTSLYNSSFQWEKNNKTELALDLGFLSDRILLSAAFFRSLSDNQLVDYTLPTQTGFTSILENLNATIVNKGWEFQLSSKNISSNAFTWNSAFNLTVSKNKLLSFPGLESSTYAGTYIIGQSVSSKLLYTYLGVDPQTGVYQFQDVNKDGKYNQEDRNALVSTDPEFYGGFQNSVRYKNFSLDIFFEFKKQNGVNYLANVAGSVPGYKYYNQPVVVLSRWQNPGDVATIQKFTSAGGAALSASNLYLRGSNAIYSDASYIRLKNTALSYTIPQTLLKKLRLVNCRVYLQGQNLFTITKYIGADPENQSIFVLPPLKTVTAGIQLTL